MGIEIERKYLVNDRWKPTKEGHSILQGYLSGSKENTIRVRIKNEQAFLTIKGSTKGISRAEYEYQIPLQDAIEMMKLCGDQIIEKTRYEVEYKGNIIEVDVFEGKHKGLIIAEIELLSEDLIPELPDWIEEEVSSNPKYYNSNLAKAKIT